jgi:hypothetical protein
MPTNLPVPPPADPLLPPQQPTPKPDVLPPDDPNHDRTDREPSIDPPPTDPGVDDPGPDRERRLVSGPAWLAARPHGVHAYEVHV